MIERLKILQANKEQFANGRELSENLQTNLALRSEVNTLSKAFFNKPVSGCSNCYFDAYMDLINLNIEKAMKKIECEFELLAGAVLKDINGSMDFLCSNANITTELALYHLKSNPNCIDQFQKTPENLEKLLEEFELPEIVSEAIQAKKEADKANIDKANGIIENQKTEIAKLKGEAQTKDNRITELENDKTALEGQIEERDEKIVKLENQLAETSRQLTMEQARAENDVRKYVAVLTRAEMLELIDADDLSIEITDEMTDDAVREAIISECEKVDAIDADAQKQAEDTLVLQIAERIKAGETKTSIKESLKDGTVGERKLTQRFINELVARADELNK